MDFKDYYQTLGVARTASEDDIRKAYRRLARQYHPDVSKEADATTRMAEINEAHEVLRDKEKRAAYDALAEQVARGTQPGAGFQAPPGWEQGFEFGGQAGTGSHNFSEFFDSMFGAAQARRRANGTDAGANYRARGEDQHASLEITLEAALRGGEHELTLRALEFGADDQPQWVNRTLAVKIPPGVRPGQFIRLAGQGLPGHGGATAGDLYLEVHVAPHPRYRIDGADLYMTLPVSPTEAALGAQVKVPLPVGGVVEVTIPPNARGGMKLRLKDRGLPGKTPGHLYLALDLVLPPVSNEAVRAAYRALAEANPHFNPRQHLGV